MPRFKDRPGIDDDDDVFTDEFRLGGGAPSATNLHHQPSLQQRSRRTSGFWLRILVGLLFLIIVAVVFFVILGKANKEESLSEAAAYLSSLEITSAEVFQDTKSPQYKALSWIVRKDPLDLDITDSQFTQRYIMAVFVYALVPQSVENLFRDQFHFLSERHECDWQSLWRRRADSAEVHMGFHCNDNQEIQKIVMPTVGLAGEIPQEISFLPELKRIVLDANEIGGPIPIVPALTSLSIAYNNLDGTIQDEVTQMTNLKELILSENFLTGRLPDGIHQLQKLTRLSINGNQLTGGIASVYNITSLEKIFASFNVLRDTFDNDSFGNLTNLQVLDFKNNKLEGPFPDAIWTLPVLEVADFHFNDLDGHLHEIKDKHQPILRYLDVSQNFLGGGLPETLNKLDKLTHLDVSANRFDKLLPDDLSGMTSLQTLLLTDNGPFGPQPIPDWLQSMSALKHLSLKLTGRTGTIPDWFATSLVNLETLDMDWNRLEGTLSADFALMTNLRHLMLNRNWLGGSVPTEVAALPKLQTLMVDNNNFVGTLDVCQAASAIADCGNVKEGCPNCESVTMEVSCPCCSDCCYDGEEYCNTIDWLGQILESKRENKELTYEFKFRPTQFTPKDVLDPAD